jgi:hypothetical protein
MFMRTLASRTTANDQLPLAKRTIRSRISSKRWEQIKTAYAATIGLREIARKMDIPEGTVLACAKRSHHVSIANSRASRLGPTDSGRNRATRRDAITPVQSVPQSLAAILSERKERNRAGLKSVCRGSCRTSGRASRQALDLRKGERRGRCP